VNRYFLFLSCLLLFGASQAETQDTIKVAVRINVQKDKIQLRWAVNNSTAWHFTNRNGFLIERYTVMRDGKILDTPEKTVLTSSPLKPPVLNDWQKIAMQDQYAAIIAQALYGKDFEVSGGKKGIGEIIGLSQQQEQRYALAMYAADLSYPAALFAGWGYEDKSVSKGEKYLYRIVPVGQNARTHIEVGMGYAAAADYENLPKPFDLNAIWNSGSVLLSWNYQQLIEQYNAYYIERSEDGSQFRRINRNPLTNVSGGDRIFFTDSIRNGQKYYYRVAGLTPFGETGPYSDTIQGCGKNQLAYIPIIKHVIPRDKGGVDIEWTFDEVGNKSIKGFELQRSLNDKGNFETAIANISPEKRAIFHGEPLAESYYRIAALPLQGDEPVYSFPFLLQMPDSTPPSIPVGLKGTVDSLGIVRLSWTANTEADMLGYRIYKGQTEGEELVPMNDVAVRTNSFSDTVSLNTLNAKVFYSVTAIDKRYNQSRQCSPINLLKPLKVKPASPYIAKCEAEGRAIRLEWIPGSDETIKAYSVWRGESNDEHLKQVCRIENPKDTFFVDTKISEGIVYKYEVRSINRGNKESDPSPTAYGRSNSSPAENLIKKFTGKHSDEGIMLKWELTSNNFNTISIYRKSATDTSFTLWKSPEILSRELLDSTAKQNTVYEYMLVIKDQNGKPIHKQIKVD
jgi:fibronectin type 3 domain-containing protein